MCRVDADDFSQTRWSLVHMLGDRNPDHADEALVELALRYWYPVYAYLRANGHAPSSAQDVAHAFFRDLPARYVADPVSARSRFRAWLLCSLRMFLAGDWHELANGEPFAAAPDVKALERRYRRVAQLAGNVGEHAFLSGFAEEVLLRGLRRLRAEACAAGHAEMFEALRPFLAVDPPSGRCKELAERLPGHPLGILAALRCLRTRFRELARMELADTVESRADLLVEQQWAMETLRGVPGA
ncbi:MAG: hypothetical protein EPN36_01905 [Rhodanobacteraceae bacterium]|nr:MAG: hypothetical protein EPN36_01905 [Rhodanobacteraceae bacterium]